MRIGICGTMSVGKTTLVKALGQLPQFKNYFIATERSQYLKSLGIPLNTDSTLLGQFIFLAERSSELMHGSLITDRTVWDICAFTENAKSMNITEKQEYIEAAMNLSPYYDVIFYISPEGIEIEDNGVRETDSRYRQQIDDSIVGLLDEYPPSLLFTLKGSTEERIKSILEAINKYL
jgi:nicotinamide riboside kinase